MSERTSGRKAPATANASRQMRMMPTRDTGPELALRRMLHASGLRYTLCRKDLPGKPDIVLSRARIAVFVDGCFWHRCPRHYTAPKNNAEWWKEKIDRNVERDRRNDRKLRGMGWLPVHIWEHQSIEIAAGRIIRAWRRRHNRAAKLGGKSQ